MAAAAAEMAHRLPWGARADRVNDPVTLKILSKAGLVHVNISLQDAKTTAEELTNKLVIKGLRLKLMCGQASSRLKHMFEFQSGSWDESAFRQENTTTPVVIVEHISW
ncbi:hypothetical protein ABZP36_031399 [Zizania latifolia]